MGEVLLIEILSLLHVFREKIIKCSAYLSRIVLSASSLSVVKLAIFSSLDSIIVSILGLYFFSFRFSIFGAFSFIVSLFDFSFPDFDDFTLLFTFTTRIPTILHPELICSWIEVSFVFPCRSIARAHVARVLSYLFSPCRRYIRATAARSERP